jgi:DnaK suppressor protein
MDKATEDNYRSRLRKRCTELQALRDISSQARAAVELDQTSVGRVSRVDALQAQQMALAQERAREAELVRIAAALKRIEDGEYGECIKCGDEIAAKRLDFDPSVPTCISCAK